MIKEPRIPLFDLIMCLSDAIDLVSPAVVNHHKQAAYIAFSIGTELGLPMEQRNELMLAGALHDCGALSLKDRIDTLQFEAKEPHRHAELGYLLIKKFKPLSSAASLIRFHHVPWSEGSGSEFMGKQVPMGSHVLHLAERISILINKRQEVLGQVEEVRGNIVEHSGKMFMPEIVDAFMGLATKEYFWLDATSPTISSILARSSRLVAIELDIAGLLNLAEVFCRIIDFRSRFTATHSTGVAASAEAIAGFIGLSGRECRLMKIAGRLHDLGKLAVPVEILEKPAKLTEDEFNIIKSHPYYTYRILETISDLDVINVWAAFHHERVDGKGYPFHHKGEDLVLGSRIMAIADVFTAITEDRPYRKGMANEEALQVLRKMAESSALDSNIVSAVILHCDEINSIRMADQIAAYEECQEFWREYEEFCQMIG